MATNTSGQGGELDAARRDALPDSQFAFPAQRKEPLSDAAHVRNAIARFDQVEGVSDHERDEAFGRITRAAARFGVELTESSWRELGKPRRGPKGEPSRDALYQEAKRRNIKGRSTMTKAQLARAVGH